VQVQARRRRANGAGSDAQAPLFSFNRHTPVNACTASQVFPTWCLSSA
jgi:hypothetical protein